MNGPNSSRHLKRTLIFECWEVRCGSKNGKSNYKNPCLFFDVPAKHLVYLDAFRKV